MQPININELDKKRIEDIIDEETEIAKVNLATYYSPIDSNTIETIVERFASKLDKGAPEESLEALSRIPDRTSLNDFHTNQIFERLKEVFEDKKNKCLLENAEDDRISHYTMMIDGMERIAEIVFHRRISTQLTNLDLPERLTYIKKAIAEIYSENNRFRYKVLLEYKERIEREFEIIEQEAEYQKLLQNIKINRDANLQSQETELNISENTEPNFQNKVVEFTMRQKVLALMLLAFGRLDAPEDLVHEDIVKFFLGLTGGDIKKLRDLIRNPTLTKGNKQSIKLLCRDLHIIREQFGKLGITGNNEKIKSEIDFLIDNLEKN